jgi:AMP deaminase
VTHVHLGDHTLSSELSAIYTNIQKVLDLRHKYLRVSLQRNGDSPKDDPSWKIYPPPPPPVWVEDPSATSGAQNSVSNEATAAERSFWAGHEKYNSGKRRKPGEDIGEDFVFEECEILGPDEMVFRLDDKGVYQVYENRKGIIALVNAWPRIEAHCPDSS